MRPPGTPEPAEGPSGGPRPRADHDPSPDAHVGAGRLAAVALGDPADARDGAHLSGCARCREELADLRGLVGVARADDTARPVPPPPGLWERIAADAGVSADPRRPPGLAGPPPASPDERAPAPPAAGSPPAAARVPDPPAVARIPAPRRARRALPVAAALVVGLVLGAAGLAAVRSGGPAAGGAEQVVATADLGPVGTAGAGAAGSAVLRGAGGARTLEVDVSGLAAPAGYYELWLLDPAGGLVSLGVVAGDRVVVGLPADLDVGRYPVVDLSDEPLDGDPAHSAESVLRGTLDL